MSIKRSNRVSRFRQGKLVTAGLLAVFGFGIATGCNSNARYERAGLTLGEDQQRINQERNYISSKAVDHRMPAQYVAEARVSMAEIERDLANASTNEVRRQAAFREAIARNEAQRQAALSQEQIASAEADKLRQQFQAQQDQIAARLAARQNQLAATTARDHAVIDALTQERTTLRKDIVSQAEQNYADALARIDKLTTVRQTTETESLAAIDDLTEAARVTRERAQATRQAILVEAEAVEAQTSAAADELTVQINTVLEQSQAESGRLAARAASFQEDAQAYAAQLRARATALDSKASKEEFQVRVNRANTDWDQAQARFAQTESEIAGQYARTDARRERLVADSNVIRQNANSDFERDLKSLESWQTHSRGEVRKLNLQADRAEIIARNEFVRAEADARAAAILETSAHQTELAEEQMRAIAAQAQREAARVTERIYEDLARKQRQGRIETAGKTGPESTPDENLHEVPPKPAVEEVATRVEPERIAAYRAALAEVMRDRTIAAAQQRAIEATYAQRRSNIEASRNQQLAIATENLARADVLATQAKTQLENQTAVARAQLAAAKASRDRAIVEAEAFQKEAQAMAGDLRAEAQATDQVAKARVNQFLAESEMVKRNGTAEAEALKAQLRALQQRGRAEQSRLIAEAGAIHQSETALAAQIDAQIDAARRTLDAELAKLDRSIESQGIIAKADYDESLVRAAVIAKKTEVEIARIRAQNALAQSLTAAEISRGQSILNSTRLKSEADVQRVIAEARAQVDKAQADYEAELVRIHADSAVVDAQVEADRRAAAARQAAVRSQFDARIVQTESDRLQALAAEYRQDQFRTRNLEQALAEATSARADSQQRLSDLKRQQIELQQAALTNWDSKLAGLRKEAQTPDSSFEVPNPSDTPVTTSRQTVRTGVGAQVITTADAPSPLDAD